MDKRSDTMTFRLPNELKQAVEAIAIARDSTPSSVVCAAVAELVARERHVYLSLSRAFAGVEGVPSAPGEERADV